jgi:hypothetical protein
MRNSFIFALAPVVLMLSTAAHAKASVEAVIAACERTKGCSYNTTNDGSINGCSPKVCFDCDVKTRECTAIGRKGGKIPIRATIGGVKLSPPPTKGGHPVNVGGAKAPNPGVQQTGSGSQPVTIEHSNTEHSGGGGGGSKK